MIMMGPGQQAERPIVAQFDKDKDRRLNATERQEARLWLESQPGPQRGGRGRGGQMVGSPGLKLSPESASVKKYGNEPLYDPSVLRTFFFEFENDDWEKELMAFYNTDVEVPATLVVDGKTYKNVGLHFRGASSFMGVPAGLKHSINVAMDFVDDKQTLLGYRTLNLLNSHVDPSMLRTVLFMQAAREYLPAPKANYARVVLNGESWGIYPNVQQYNKEFINEWFKTTDGARWKVPGSPGGRGGLEYVGDDPAAYKRSFEIKSKDDPKSWEALIRLCKTLNTTPPEQLEKALAPILDIDQTLRFLAIDATLVNGDGYWTRASDYSIYLDPKGVFHLFPHDANETFGSAMGPPPPPPPPPGGAGGVQVQPIAAPGGRGGGPRPGGAELDPLVGMNDVTKPLRSKLLAVPALRERYMTYVRQIASKWLDWNTLSPIAQRHQALIAADVKADTRKLNSNEQFEAGLATLKTFADTRRAFLVK
jgi:spore coat protein CotH